MSEQQILQQIKQLKLQYPFLSDELARQVILRPEIERYDEDACRAQRAHLRYHPYDYNANYVGYENNYLGKNWK